MKFSKVLISIAVATLAWSTAPSTSYAQSAEECLCIVPDVRNGQPIGMVLEATGQELPQTRPILEINIGHPLVSRLSAETDETRFRELSNIVLDHALLAEGTQLSNPADYVRRINKLLLDMGTDEQAGNAR